MIEQIVLGCIQGLTEWLPVSSKALLILAKIHLFGSREHLSELIEGALLLHIGTFFSALVYFWNDIVAIVKKLLKSPKIIFKKRGSLSGFLVTTLISAGLAFSLLQLADYLAGSSIESMGRVITGLTGILLLVTGILQMKSKSQGSRNEKDVTMRDGIILGLTQGLAGLPGFSRSGLTVSALILRNFSKTDALRLSFLMSLPIIFLGNIILNFSDIIAIDAPHAAGIFSAFIVGILSIKILLLVAQKVNFGYFVIGFGMLTLLASVIS